MKNHFSAVSKLVVAAVCALSLGSCSRAEYAMLPKSASYHGVARVATPVPATPPATAVAAAPAAPAEAASVAAAAPVQPAKAEAVAPATRPATVAAAPAAAATTTTLATTPKLSLVQRMALNKVTRKMDKLVQKSGSVRQHDNTASTSKTAAISGNLRTGLILLLVGLLVGLLNGLIGTIIAIIGLIFIVLWLLDQM